MKGFKHIFWALNYVFLSFLMFRAAFGIYVEAGFNNYMLLAIGMGCITSLAVYSSIKNFLWERNS